MLPLKQLEELASENNISWIFNKRHSIYIAADSELIELFETIGINRTATTMYGYSVRLEDGEVYTSVKNKRFLAYSDMLEYALREVLMQKGVLKESIFHYIESDNLNRDSVEIEYDPNSHKFLWLDGSEWVSMETMMQYFRGILEDIQEANQNEQGGDNEDDET